MEANEEPTDRRMLKFRIFTVILFIVLATAGIVFSIYLFAIADNTYMYFIASSFLLLALISGFFNVFSAYWYYRSGFYEDHLAKITRALKPLKTFPLVAIAVPVYNENPATVKETVNNLFKMDYPKDKIEFFILDDSSNADINKELEAFSKAKGVAYLHRNERRGFKAGALNDMLKHSNAEFIAVFDSDEMLTDPKFLKDLLPYFEDKRMSYVQTSKRSRKGTFFSDSVDLFNVFFFKFIQSARALDNTAIFAGSCGIIRRSVLEKIGGFPEYIIEDTFFSFESDMHNYTSLYIPKTYALGEPIYTFTALAKQQWRYNYGDTQFLSYFLNSLKNKKKGESKVSLLSGLDYLAHGLGLNYVSVIPIMFTLISILIVFSSLPFNFVGLQQFLTMRSITSYMEAFGMIAFVLSLMLPVVLTKLYFNSISKGIMVSCLNFGLAFVRAKAALSALLKIGNPFLKWQNSRSSNRIGLLASIFNTRVELAFAGILLVFAAFAFQNFNIYGGAWLVWYGAIYSLATILLYKYG